MKTFNLRRKLKVWTEILVEVLVIISVLYLFFWPLRVDGLSMEDTFNSGDRVIISKVFIWLGFYGAGDVVVVNILDDNNENERIIKRVIGLSGDHIVIKDGKVMRNGYFIDEPYIKNNTYGNVDLIVSENHIFVLGDNREVSKDSRAFGEVDKNRVLGKVIIKWYPFNQISFY